MNQSIEELDVISMDGQANSSEGKEIGMQDYDDLPYGEDNVLVRASKRRAFLAASSIM